MTRTGPVRVAFVGGHGRSGSTLLSRVLGGVPGCCAVGELRYLWSQGVARNRMCACGRRFRRCPFWTQVGDVAFGGWGQVDIREVRELHRTLVRNRYLPLLLAPRVAPSFERRLQRYVATTARVYQAVRQVSGCELVIDSSKFPSSAYLLRHVPDLDLRLIHLVRSSQAVCYAYTKVVQRPDRGGRLMARHPPATSALEWLGFNFALEGLGLMGVPSTLVRYEEFVRRPREEIGRLLAFLGQDTPSGQLSFVGEHTVELYPDHSVAGNPMRLRTGSEELRLDEEWRTALPARTRRLVTVVTAPGLVRYGYLRGDSASRPRRAAS